MDTPSSLQDKAASSQDLADQLFHGYTSADHSIQLHNWTSDDNQVFRNTQAAQNVSGDLALTNTAQGQARSEALAEEQLPVVERVGWHGPHRGPIIVRPPVFYPPNYPVYAPPTFYPPGYSYGYGPVIPFPPIGWGGGYRGGGYYGGYHHHR